MTAIDTPRAWVGCLGCYNEGNLVGKWLDDPDEIREYRCPRPKTIYNLHEELWVMDHECMPLISGECSPAEFADAMEFLDGLDRWRPVDAVAAWLDDMGESWRDADLSQFDDLFRGEWDSEADYTESFYADTAETVEQARAIRDGEGLMFYVDWDRVARDLFMSDCWSTKSPNGVYVFWRF